jgi:deoxyribodipyrimidine photo-lyase
VSSPLPAAGAAAPPAIVWLRNDLRLRDNPALAAACSGDRPVVLLYVLDPSSGARALGAASLWWLDKSLASLKRDVEALGGRLTLRRGASAEVLDEVIAETGAQAVYWNRLYDQGSIERDSAIKQALRGRGLECRSFNAGLLSEPWEVKTGAGAPYKVFSAYWRAAAPKAGTQRPHPSPHALVAPDPAPRSEVLGDWGLHPRRPDWSTGFSIWTPGEAGAHARLEAFLVSPARAYAEDRNRPDREATSRLSPHLHFGEIGPRQVWAATQAAMAAASGPTRGHETFLKEIGWREFDYQLLHNFPQTQTRNLDSRFDAFPWRDDPAAFAAWREGRTGYPIVDAGMRQLWETGWMHNRVRMIVASFLVKDLLIDWRAGEAWFWDTLVDADLANNVGGWQWTAGSGADAAPYFRIFNPILQAERFDPSGDYVRRWIPELAPLPNDCIQTPWAADDEVLTSAGVRLGVTYPRPIIDHAQARDLALSLYERLR